MADRLVAGMGDEVGDIVRCGEVDLRLDGGYACVLESPEVTQRMASCLEATRMQCGWIIQMCKGGPLKKCL